VTGTIAATAALLSVRSIGFKPRKVSIKNQTSLYQVDWTEGMADASAFETTNAGAMTLETSDLITPLDPDTSGNAGFSVGARANVNDAAGEVLRYECWE
jgi:hypothetical protein